MHRGKDEIDEVHGMDSRRPVVRKKGSWGLMEVEKRGETKGCREREKDQSLFPCQYSVCVLNTHLTAREMVR